MAGCLRKITWFLAPARRAQAQVKVGDEVRLTEAGFVRLSRAFFAEMEKKYL